jgi:hypothetical protein
MTVFTIATDAFSASARPFNVATSVFPGVENVIAIDAMMVPTIVPPPAGLVVAVLPTCQNTFLACAPLIRITLRGAPRTADGERAGRLKHPYGVGVALRVQREIRAGNEERTTRSPVHTRGQRESAQLALAWVRAAGTGSRIEIEKRRVCVRRGLRGNVERGLASRRQNSIASSALADVRARNAPQFRNSPARDAPALPHACVCL